MNCWKFIYAVLMTMTMLFSYSTSNAQTTGQIRYNTSSDVLQIYNGSSWDTIDFGAVGWCTAAINGACDNSTRNACTSGTPNDGAVADTSTEYRWRCIGLYGGSNSGICSKLKPITGVCNNGTRNSCSSGFANDGAYADTSTEWRWRCDGQGGGSDSAMCTAPRPINGVCNNGTRNSCSAGTANDAAVSDLFDTWRWRCDGQNGGSDSATCTAPRPVTGVCNNGTQNSCSAGNANDGAIADTSTEFRWRCDGINGGPNSGTCTAPKVISGVCNNGTRNSCSAGNANDGAISDLIDTWRWRCDGINGGSNSGTCTAPRPADGVCNNGTRNSCSVGTANDGAYADTVTEYRWRCDGVNGGVNSGVCTSPKTVNGSCGSAASGSCTTSQPGSSLCGNGSYSDISDTSTLWRWQCVGSGGGTTATCTRDRCQSCGSTALANCNVSATGHGGTNGSCTGSGSCSYTCNDGNWNVNSNTCVGPINGVCNNSVRNACAAGTSNDGAVGDTGTLWRWRCDGQNGGSNSGICAKNKPVNGVCNNGTRNSCSAGSANDGAVGDTGTEYRWRCDGQYGGSNSGTCTAPKAINGSCNNGTRNSCSAGTANDGAVSDLTDTWRWRCDGLNGGSNSGTCTAPRPVNGSCNNGTRNSCSAGTANDGAVGDTGTLWRWRCDGINGGSNSSTCTANKPVNGSCNNGTRNSCSAGTANDGAVGDTGTQWRWRCDGQYGGSNSGTCTANKPVNGSCNNATRNACSAGTANDGAVADSPTQWRWRCDGQYGGSNSGTCAKNKPVNGVCNNGTRNSCSAGSANDGAYGDAPTQWRWRCDGQYGGSNSGMCTAPRTVNGSCGSANGSNTQSSMPTGSAACSAGTQTNTSTFNGGTNFHSWTCSGANGGSSANCNASGPGSGGCPSQPTMEGVCMSPAGSSCEVTCCNGSHVTSNCGAYPFGSAQLCMGTCP